MTYRRVVGSCRLYDTLPGWPFKTARLHSLARRRRRVNTRFSFQLYSVSSDDFLLRFIFS